MCFLQLFHYLEYQVYVQGTHNPHYAGIDTDGKNTWYLKEK